MKKTLLISGLILFLGSGLWGIDYTWDVSEGDWDDPANWIITSTFLPATYYPGEGGPGVDTATIPDGIVTLNVDDLDLASVTISGGTLNVNADNFTVTSIQIEDGGTLNLGAYDFTAPTFDNDGTVTLTGATGQLVSDTIGGAGTVYFNATGTTLAGIAVFPNLTISTGNRSPSSDVVALGTLTIASGVGLYLADNNLVATNITNNGTITLDGASGQTVLNTTLPATIGGSGLVNFNAGTGPGMAGLTTFPSLTISSGARTAPGNLTVNGTLTVGAGASLALTGGNNLTVGGDLTNSGTISPGTGTVIFNGGNQSFTPATSTFNNITKNGTGILTVSGALTATGTVTIGSGRVMALASYNLSGNPTITNNGELTLTGTQTVTTTPAATIGGTGTVHFNTIGGATLPLAGISRFNGNLTIDNGMARNVSTAVRVDGNADIGANLTANSFQVDGTSNIETVITTTGNQIYTGAVTVGSEAVFTSGGDITFDSTITGTRLDARASNGTVTLNRRVTVSGTGSEGPDTAAVYILADSLEGDFNNLAPPGIGISLTGAGGAVCLNLNEAPDIPDGTVTGNRWHLHAKGRHIVYSDDKPASWPDDYMWVEADSASIGSAPVLHAPSGFNIYILTVASNTKNPSFYNDGTSDYIEFRETYNSSGNLFMNSGSNVIRLNYTNINLSSNSFDTNGRNILIVDEPLMGPSMISASSITLGGTTTRDPGPPVSPVSSAYDLTLSTGGTISIIGAMGTDTNNLGYVYLNGNTIILDTDAAIYATRVNVNNTGVFTQSTGADIVCTSNTFTQIGAGQSNLSANITTTSRDISFNGPVVTGGTTLSTGSTGVGDVTFNSTIGGTGSLSITAGTGNIKFSNSVSAGAITLNHTGLYTQSSTVTASDKFTQTGNGTTSINGNIFVTSETKTTAAISFDSMVSLTKSITFETPTSGGSVYLGNGIFGGNGPYYGLTLKGGRTAGTPAGTLDFSQGTGTVDCDITIATESYVSVPTGIVRQTADKTITLTAGSAATPTTLETILGSWYMGDETVPALTPAFASGFLGFSGNILFNSDTRLRTRDFYNEPLPSTHTITIGGTDVRLTATGNVWINKEFATSGGRTLLDSTLEMTGTGRNLSVRTSGPGGAGDPLVNIGHFIAHAPSPGTSTLIDGEYVLDPGTTINTNIRFLGTVKIGEDDDIVRSDLTVLRGSYSDANPGPYINVQNDWIQAVNGGSVKGSFDPKKSIVEFGDKDLSYTAGEAQKNSYLISGETTWYILACHENFATLKFSNYGLSGILGHTVKGKLEIKPSNPDPNPDLTTHTNLITLTREKPYTGPPPTYPSTPVWIPPSGVNSYFWYFDLQSTAKLDIEEVEIRWSYSKNKIPVPKDISTPGASKLIRAWPYVEINETSSGGEPVDPGPPAQYPHPDSPNSHWNVNWFVFNNFFYGFTEDSNHNGRIDRLRLQSAFNVNGDFSGFKVKVENYHTKEAYEVSGYSRVQEDVTLGHFDLDSIYVHLVEKPYADTGAILYWEIVDNPNLKDLQTGYTTIGNPKSTDPNDPEPDSGIATDTAPPRITYSLALPYRSEIFFQTSERIDSAMQAEVSSPFSVPAAAPRSVNSSRSEYLIDLQGNSYTLEQLASGSENFTVTGMEDRAVPAYDLHDPLTGNLYYYMYPSPKYPRDYNYNDDGSGSANPFQSYVYVSGNPPSSIPTQTGYANVAEDSPNRAVYPPNMSYNISDGKPEWDTSPPYAPQPASVDHRVTDMLVSVPPNSGRMNQYFAWPVWAKYDEPVNSLTPDESKESAFFSQTPEDAGIIWEFSGRRYLEARDTVMQVRRNPELSTTLTNPKLVFAYNVPSYFRGSAVRNAASNGIGQRNEGLWVPGNNSIMNPLFSNMSAFFLSSLRSPTVVLNPAPDLFIYRLTTAADGIKSGNNMEFFLHLDGLSPSDLFVGRLDIQPNAGIPAAWYYLVRPFSFRFNDVTLQRSGVTILNNVINPGAGETVYLDYRLSRSGQVTIQVFTLDGTMVSVLYRGSREAGEYRAAWNGTNSNGRAVARGMYFIRIVGPDIDEIRKVMVIR